MSIDAEAYLDDSPELLLDQLRLQRVARNGQLGIFGHGVSEPEWTPSATGRISTGGGMPVTPGKC